MRKRIHIISEIYDGKNLLITDFSDLDLSNIDLSAIPMEMWEGCIFFNTNFSNTGIKFIPNKLGCIDLSDSKYHNKQYLIVEWGHRSKVISLIDCDFSNNDLAYLKEEDFKYNNLKSDVWTEGANFRSTGVTCLRRGLYNMTLDEGYADFGYDEWAYQTWGMHHSTDMRTIVKNPFLKTSSVALAYIIMHCIGYGYKEIFIESIWKQMKISDPEFWKACLDKKVLEKLIPECENFLEYDKQGHLKRFYEQIKDCLTLQDKYWFFRAELHNANIKNVQIKNVPIELLRVYAWEKCNFENVTLDYSLSNLMKIYKEHIIDNYGLENHYKNFYLPSIKYDSWRERDAKQKRVSDSAITFYTKIYLELSRVCNAKCGFCRNNSFEKCDYDLDSIKHTINMVKSKINAIVIGGGEPTLRLMDVIMLKQYFKDEDIDWHMFTNGSNLSIIDNEHITNNFKINLSRHAINDDENARIFKLDSSRIMTLKDIERLNATNTEVTLNATCFKGGLDSVDKITAFINLAKSVGCKKLLIQDLQKSISLGKKGLVDNNLEIEPNIFAKVMEYLANHNFRQKPYPIYATGGYVSYIFKDKDDFSVSIQKYITKQELEANWSKAIKRAFDLSIDPSGKLYENWHQNSGIVETL